MDARNSRPRIGLLTFGCRVNQYDAQMMQGLLAAEFRLVKSEADVYLVNACTVTSLAERKARQAIRRLRRDHPQAKIVLIGCLADAASQGLSRVPDVDLLAGNAWKGRINEVVKRALAGDRGVLPVIGAIPLKEETSPGPVGRIRAFLKIQDGCDRSCTFCRTSQVRGPARSKPVAAALSEAQLLVEHGYPEIVLTGINLARYAPPDGTLADLVECLLTIRELRRLRLGSINPSGITAELVEAIASDRRACPHFHIPLQSGDDTILQRMQRGYTVSFYLSRVDLIRRSIPEATFGADVIVGFPGEDEAGFARTCEVVNEVGFANLHIFRYSPRIGTPAMALIHQVSAREKQRRAKVMHELGTRVRHELFAGYLGREEEVLIEERRNGYWRGFTRGYIDTRLLNDNGVVVGDMVNIRITQATCDQLGGAKDDKANVR